VSGVTALFPIHIGLTLAVLVLSAASLRADEWPQWCGPLRNSTWWETGILDRFPGQQIKLRWTAKIGPGYSGPTVYNGRVYVTDHVKEPKEGERVHCFDFETGQKVWSYGYPCDYGAISYKAGPRAAVTLYAGRAFSLGAVGHLHCFNAATGEVLWKKDLVAQYHAKVPVWGVACAPLAEGPSIIVIAGGQPRASVMAFDVRTGDLRWSALDDPIAYSSPIVVEQAGKRIVVCWTATRIVGLDSTTGKLYWEQPYKFRRWVDAILTPVVYKDRLFISSFTEGSLMLKLAKDQPTASQVWRRVGRDERATDSLHSLMCQPYIADEHIYGFDSYGQMRCLEAGMGNRAWENLTVTSQIRWGSAHMVMNNGRAWIFNDQGELIIGELSPGGFKELSRAKLLPTTTGQHPRGVTWSPPAFAYKHVFNRNDEELVCASLAADPGTSKKEWWKRLKN
jgi:outer membrane protein assembly factor BamB